MSDEPIDRNPDILGGTPVFASTRVPVRVLMEYLEAGDRLDDFIQDFPSVSRDQAVAVLERARMSLTGEQDEAAACRVGSPASTDLLSSRFRGSNCP